MSKQFRTFSDGILVSARLPRRTPPGSRFVTSGWSRNQKIVELVMLELTVPRTRAQQLLKDLENNPGKVPASMRARIVNIVKSNM